MVNGRMGHTKSDLRVHSKGGKVIVASREVEIDLSPTQALVFAQLLIKHAGRARQQEQS